MADLELVIGDKMYSSWSLRPWIALTHAGIPFRETKIRLRRETSKAEILAHSPSGKVPLLKADGLLVWDSLAIVEYLAERFPEAGLWPEDAAARAAARAVSAEMHAGFAALRDAMPMDIEARSPGVGRTPAALADIARIEALFEDCRARFGADGPFLFGRFTAADAMFAPVVSRFVTYGVTPRPVARAYCDAVWALPAFARWRADAAEERAAPASTPG